MIELSLIQSLTAVVTIGISFFTIRVVSVFMRRKPSRSGDAEKDYMDPISRCLVLFDETQDESIICVHAAQIFEDRVNFAGFVKQFVRIYGGEGRFSQRLVQNDGRRAYWTRAKDKWEPMDNITCIEEHTGHEEFEKLLGEMCSTPLPLDNPPWRLAFLQNYMPQDSDQLTSAFVWKYHHSIADGFTAMRHVVSHCTPVDENKTMEELFPSRQGHDRSHRARFTMAYAMLVKFIGALLKLVFLQKDTPNPCKPSYRLGLRDKRVCSFAGLGEEFSVEKIKDLASRASHTRQQKTTVNDILLAAASNALSRYCDENSSDDKPGGLDKLTSAVWVALNAGSPFQFYPNESRWGNEKLGVCYLDFPLKSGTPLEQLDTVCKGIRKLIGSPEPYIANRLFAFIGSLPYCIAKPLWWMVADKATLSISNVPGPQAALRWPVNRHEDLKDQIPNTGIIKDLLFLVPPTFDIGIMLCIISYNGRVNVGMATAGDWINQAQADRIIKEFFPQSLREMTEVITA